MVMPTKSRLMIKMGNKCSTPCFKASCVCTDSNCIINLGQNVSEQELHQRRNDIWDTIRREHSPEERIKSLGKLMQIEKQLSKRGGKN